MSDSKQTAAAAPTSEGVGSSTGHSNTESRAGGDGPRWPSASAEIRSARTVRAQVRAADRSMVLKGIEIHRRRMRELRGEQ